MDTADKAPKGSLFLGKEAANVPFSVWCIKLVGKEVTSCAKQPMVNNQDGVYESFLAFLLDCFNALPPTVSYSKIWNPFRWRPIWCKRLIHLTQPDLLGLEMAHRRLQKPEAALSYSVCRFPHAQGSARPSGHLSRQGQLW